MSHTPAAVVELVERFERNLDSYRNPGYNETQLRLEFINPLFRALGWDVINEQGLAEAYKDVIHELTLKLKIEDKVLKDIIKRLYYPDSPYEFSVFPVEILGQVYEQFLGKVIRLTAGHQAKVEEKPEVKKAGGVYYTPAYIVGYIVRHTVGTLCEGKTPKQIEKLRILDPACGSGSFLIGAYDYLMTYHRDRYVKDGPDKHRKELYRTASGDWRLTTQEKKRILLNNIYGVDIDPQAVEVTKLSLLLKVLEGETDETLRRQLSFVHERALPDLGSNIKCGNSLIGPDYFEGQLLPDEEEMRRVNPFGWKTQFPEIMKAGGFDAVIGNPPYVRIQIMKEWAPLEVETYKELYESASKGNYDIYVVFVEKGLSLLDKNGRLGFILPHKFFQAQYGESLRGLISKGKHLAEVVHFGDQQVFEGATTYTCLLFLDKGGSESCRFKRVEDLSAWQSTWQAIEGSIPAKNITNAEWNFTVGKGAGLFEKLSKIPVKLGDVADRLYQGPITSADSIFLFKKFRAGKKKGLMEVFSEELNEWVIIEPTTLKPVIRSGSVGRYRAVNTAMVLERLEEAKVVDRQDKEARNRIHERLKRLSAIKEYQFPIEIVKEDDLEIVTEIFIRVNSGGTRLREAELALARLAWKLPGSIVGPFEKMEDACEERGFDLDARFLMRALVSVATGQSRFKDLKTFWQQPADDIDYAWQRTEKGLKLALDFIEGNVGVPGSELRWFLLANAFSRYAGSAETVLNQDLAILGAECENIHGLLDQLLRDLRGEPKITPQDLEKAGTNSPFFPLAFLAVMRRDPTDWFKGIRIRRNSFAEDQQIEYHHIFPKKLLNQRNVDRYTRDEMANIAFLAQKANRRISSKKPAEYLAEIEPKRLEAQFVPMEKTLWDLDRSLCVLRCRGAAPRL